MNRKTFNFCPSTSFSLVETQAVPHKTYISCSTASSVSLRGTRNTGCEWLKSRILYIYVYKYIFMYIHIHVKVKVKCSCYRTGVTQRLGRGIALLFHDRSTRRVVSGQQHAPAVLYPRERPGIQLYRRQSWSKGLSGREKNLVPTGIWSPDRPTRSESLYRLRYPSQTHIHI